MHSPFTDITETTSKQWFHCQGGHATIYGINIPNGILGTLKKKEKRKKSFCGCVCQVESHKSILFIIYKNTSTIFRREGTSSQEVADHVQTPNLTLKWFAEPTNMEVVLGSTDIGLVKVEPITLICVQKERMPVYLPTHQSIVLVLNPKS